MNCYFVDMHLHTHQQTLPLKFVSMRYFASCTHVLLLSTEFCRFVVAMIGVVKSVAALPLSTCIVQHCHVFVVTNSRMQWHVPFKFAYLFSEIVCVFFVASLLFALSIIIIVVVTKQLVKLNDFEEVTWFFK